MGLRTDIVIGTLQEKLKGIGEASMIMMNSTQAKLKAAGADEMMNNLQEKMKGIGEASMIMMNSTRAELKAAGADEMMNNLQEKFLMLGNFGLSLVGWFDEIFPPETRKQILHWLRVAPYAVAGLVLLVLLWCFIHFIGCCCYFFHCIGLCIVCIFRCIVLCIVSFFRCIGLCIVHFCRCIGITMMKAPGMGFWIPRCIFEACPRICFCAFRVLRAIAGKVICC